MIFDIQRFSIHDGTGIRTTVFFKGCTLRCRWCSNPEGISADYDLLYDRSRCIACMSCVGVSLNGEITGDNGEIQIHREKIRDITVYRGVCPTGALSVAGENMGIDEIIEEIQKDSPFYAKSNGGVTLSGGEPFAQSELILPLLKRLKEKNIHTCVETSLHMDWNSIEACIRYIDVFLADLKHTDETKFTEYTDGDLRLILDNFKRLEKAHAKTIVRVPVIPTFNSSIHEMDEITDFSMRLSNVDEIHFIPYHTLGLGKYAQLELMYDFIRDTKIKSGEIEQYVERAVERGLKARIGG